MSTANAWMGRLGVGLGAWLLSAAASAQVVVVVNPKSGAANLTAEQVASLFLGKASSLPGGLSQPVDLPESNPARDQFYNKVAGKNSAQVKAIWARLAFSGKGTPPKELPASAEVKKHVAASAEAIGYIEKSALDASVKAVLTLE
jgi:ABC-type phosphate transport system substrate-binding protein